MKRIVFVVLLLIITGGFSLSKAQINRGQIILGASTSLNLSGSSPDIMTLNYTYSVNKSDDPEFEGEGDTNRNLSMNFSPRFGVFIINNLAIGLDINLAYQDKEELLYFDTYKQEITHFSAGPFIRYYLLKTKIKPFFEVNGFIGKTNITEKIEGWGEGETSNIIGSYGIGLGAAFAINNNSSFDFYAGFKKLTSKDTEDNDYNFRTVYTSFGLKFGYLFFIGRD